MIAAFLDLGWRNPLPSLLRFTPGGEKMNLSREAMPAWYIGSGAFCKYSNGWPASSVGTGPACICKQEVWLHHETTRQKEGRTEHGIISSGVTSCSGLIAKRAYATAFWKRWGLQKFHQVLKPSAVYTNSIVSGMFSFSSEKMEYALVATKELAISARLWIFSWIISARRSLV